MYVTSDIFDLNKIGRFREFEWRENLLGGVAVLSSCWPGAEAAGKFLVEAARSCDLLGKMQYAGYDTVGEAETRSLTPRSLEKVALGELIGAQAAVGVNLRGALPAAGAQNGEILFGGEACGITRADHGTGNSASIRARPMSADFIFPLSELPAERATRLLKLAGEILGAEYGYYFVRDDLCFPGAYSAGIAPALDYSPKANEEAEEIHNWAEFAREGDPWSAPRLRDLYEVNLLSARHTTQPIEGLGKLGEWIFAAPGRGRLEEIGGGRSIWTLSDAEMFNLRPLLNRAGLLLSCSDRVYRDLPAKPTREVERQ